MTRVMRVTRRRPVAALAAVVLALGLAACGDDEDPEPDAGPTGSTESTESTEPTEPTEPTESAEPDTTTPLGTGVAPADGQQVSIEGLSLRIPKDWRVVSRTTESIGAQPREYDLNFLQVLAIENDGRHSSPEAILDSYTRTELRPPEILPTVEVDGVEMFHGSGQVQKSTWVEAFGSGSTDWDVYITFKSAPTITPLEERREIADSILATVELD